MRVIKETLGKNEKSQKDNPNTIRRDFVECWECGEDANEVIKLEYDDSDEPDSEGKYDFQICKDCLKKALEMLE